MATNLKRAQTAANPIAALRQQYMDSGVPAAGVVDITPELATAMLEMNDDNRPLNQLLVLTFAGDMAAGRWRLNGEAIILSAEGYINDGQHRLWAIVEAKVPVRSMVVFGATRESRETVDLGRARSAGDILGMEGVKNAHNVASLAGHLVRWEAGKIRAKHASTESKAQIMEYYRAHREEVEDALSATMTYNREARKIGVTILALVWVLFSRAATREAASEFVHSLVSGADLKPESPILALRNRMITERRMALALRIEAAVRAWNAWRTGKAMTRMQLNGNIPEIHS